MAMRPPNLLVIMPDQLRATALGLYGNPQVRTPQLERLADSGTRFEQAFTPYPVCTPARVGFWTGRWPHLTHSRTNQIYLQPGETHLFQLLREAGYTTGLIGKNHCFAAPDIARYFDTYYPVGHGGPADDGGDPAIAAAKEWIRREMGGGGGAAYAAAVSPFPVEKHGTWLIGQHADAFLRANRDRPFCAWVSIPDPHTPYQVSEPYASLYPPDSIHLPPHEPPGYPDKPERVQLFAELMGANEVSDEHLRFVLGIYYGMIMVIDEVVGRLLDTLEELGLREDTLIVFTSDHGDYMTEHRLVRKGASLHDALVRVPLLLSQPGVVPAGATCADLVSLLDVLPTLTQLLGLPLPPGRSGRALPVVAGGEPRGMVFAETGREGERTTRAAVARRLAKGGGGGRLPWQLAANGQLKMARTHEWKYVHQPGGGHELYDLANDPHELVNLADAPEQRERVHKFQEALLDWAITSEDTLPLPTPTADRGI